MKAIKIILFSVLLTACSVIDYGKIPIETNTKGFETAGIRVGLITTKYQEVKQVSEKKSVTEKSYSVVKYILTCVLLVIVLLFFLL